MLKNVNQARDHDDRKNQSINNPIDIEDETDENIACPPVELKRKKSKLQNFPYTDLNPNYLIDQYYYTRYLIDTIYRISLPV